MDRRLILAFPPASRVTSAKQLSGKIVIKSKQSHVKATIQYKARLLRGNLTHDPTVLQFFLGGNNELVSRPLDVQNQFPVPVMIYNVSLDENLRSFFEVGLHFCRLMAAFFVRWQVEDFRAQILPVNETVTLLSLRLKDPEANLQLTSYLRLHSNASQFALPILCFNGKITPVIPLQYPDGLDFGTLGFGERRDVLYAVHNQNPLEVRIRAWGSNMTRSFVELMGTQEGNATDFFNRNNYTMLPKTVGAGLQTGRENRLRISSVTAEAESFHDISSRSYGAGRGGDIFRQVLGAHLLRGAGYSVQAAHGSRQPLHTAGQYFVSQFVSGKWAARILIDF